MNLSLAKDGGTVEISENAFGREFNEALVHQVVVSFLAAGRSGQRAQKSRSEVQGGGRKPYRQKGTGRARKGTAGSPILVGGGVAHGPRPGYFQERVPKKVKKLAVCSAFSQKASNNAISVLEDFELDAPKTRTIANMVQKCEVQDQKTLLLTDSVTENVVKSCRNLPKLSVLPVNQVSTYDLVNADALVLTQSAVDRIQALWGAS